MAMKVKNNLTAVHSLGQININITELGKALAKISSGQKINSAGDDASGMAISEKMRVRIRALEQDIQNVKNGRTMLDTAEGGLQRQLDLMRTIKAKVIDAANDSNTDDDRRIIQKEIDEYFKEIQSIAYDTDFNGIKLLIGNERLREQVLDWTVVGDPEFVEDSDVMDVIANNYDELDGIEGPFDIFQKYKVEPTTIDALFGSNESVQLSGGTDGTPAIFEMDLDAYNSPTDLIGRGFYVEACSADATSISMVYYVFRDSTANPKVDYNAIDGTIYIDVNPNNSDWKTQARDGIISQVNSVQSSYITAEADGNKVKFTSVNKHTDSNANCIEGFRMDKTEEKIIPEAEPTGLGTQNLSGGVDRKTHQELIEAGHTDPVTDVWIPDRYNTVIDSPGQSATLTRNVSDVPDQSGFIVTGYGGRQAYVRIVDGTGGCRYDANTNIYIIPKKASNGINLGNGITLTMSNGNMTLTSGESFGAQGNNWGITRDGFPENSSQAKEAILPANDATRIEDGTDGEYAHYDIDLTAYDTTDLDTLEEFIEQFQDRSITFNFKRYDGLGGFPRKYEFIDTKVPTSMDALGKQNGVTGTIDLNDVRSRVQSGQTIADAFIAVMHARDEQFFDKSTDDSKILRAQALAKGTYGNSDTMNLTYGQMSSYTIDYNDWFTSDHSGEVKGTLNEFLNGKGFRFYCATDDAQWYNVVFTDGDTRLTRPETGSSGMDVKTILIDISGLGNLSGSEAAAKLVETIYNQGEPQMQQINHHLHFRANPEEGTLTVYDARKEDVTVATDRYKNIQQMGAKISDGVVDDVVPAIKYIYNNEKRLVIQDTDKDSQQIILHIPQSSLNHIFRLDERNPDMSRYNVLTKSNRDFLLGYRVEGADTGSTTATKNLGALDKGINYLLDAITLVGAQGARLEMTESNVVTQLENETNSESTIRDADMAKEMTAYTKANVLSQAAQAMLAQANQNSSAVLSLLQ